MGRCCVGRAQNFGWSCSFGWCLAEGLESEISAAPTGTAHGRPLPDKQIELVVTFDTMCVFYSHTRFIRKLEKYNKSNQSLEWTTLISLTILSANFTLKSSM